MNFQNFQKIPVARHPWAKNKKAQNANFLQLEGRYNFAYEKKMTAFQYWRSILTM